ncbi:MAG: response regulator transcription factor [Haliscomenobacter sp.]|uniref:response regulator transcription factor n=1 Tax=Haliscomenobacter sp. TaxID=2717303 RepID=UPI001B6F38BD|nr:response regulator transcription factor [Haliscomenobacter sp.]MBP6811854.1 response regulator transcription factor [Saprospiraceae bacterium]MDX2069126.1 response regulator transcription factor [Haliscomenobacter sp.]
MKKTKISIIEDNKVVRENVSKFVGFHEEFELCQVHGSVESFLHVLNINPSLQSDILILDIGLPGLSGLEAIPLILERLPQQDIIMLTTYEEEDVILKALCSGACSYISKKASLDEIVEALRIVANGGSYMSPSIAREIVNHLMGGRVSKASILSDRQKEILEKLVDGKSYATISTELFISIETVRSHVKKLYKVLQVNNKTEAITQYMKGYIK